MNDQGTVEQVNPAQAEVTVKLSGDPLTGKTEVIHVQGDAEIGFEDSKTVH